jgi:hypothetical protein
MAGSRRAQIHHRDIGMREVVPFEEDDGKVACGVDRDEPCLAR